MKGFTEFVMKVMSILIQAAYLSTELLPTFSLLLCLNGPKSPFLTSQERAVTVKCVWTIPLLYKKNSNPMYRTVVIFDNMRQAVITLVLAC